jgi:hypothetical protein
MADVKVINWRVNDKIALKENPKWRGSISQVLNPYTAGDPTMYLVRWAGFSQDYQYLGEMLISEKEADEIKAKLEADGALKREEKKAA